MKTLNRVGVFFLLIGGGLAALFILSDIAGAPDFNLLFLGAICLLGGLFLRITNPAPKSPPSGRFSMFQRAKRTKKDEENQ